MTSVSSSSVKRSPSVPTQQRYPRPGPVGGRLIRKLVAQLRSIPSLGDGLPLGGPGRPPVYLAVSGGLDSTALLVLLAKYGRRIVTPGSLHILHVNHGWRAQASDSDESHVRALAQEWGLPITVHRAKPPAEHSKQSWEDHARTLRTQFFQSHFEANPGAWLFTAHQADDQLETLLWRLFTGTTDTHGAGILVQKGQTLRPLLQVRRQELQAFLEEEGRKWCTDHTNFDARFLRARIRSELLPTLEKIFPRAAEHLLNLGERAQKAAGQESKPTADSQAVEEALNLFWGAAGLSLRRPHLKSIFDAVRSEAVPGGKGPREWSLPSGWTLRRERQKGLERWVLERPVGTGKVSKT